MLLSEQIIQENLAVIPVVVLVNHDGAGYHEVKSDVINMFQSQDTVSKFMEQQHFLESSVQLLPFTSENLHLMLEGAAVTLRAAVGSVQTIHEHYRHHVDLLTALYPLSGEVFNQGCELRCGLGFTATSNHNQYQNTQDYFHKSRIR